jgi:hypothetical protein
MWEGGDMANATIIDCDARHKSLTEHGYQTNLLNIKQVLVVQQVSSRESVSGFDAGDGWRRGT